MKTRNYGIDLIKILACFLVVCLHTTIKSFTLSSSFGITTFLYYLGTLSIPLFFMVNGYLLLNKESLTYRYLFPKIVNILIVVLAWTFFYWLVKGNYSENPVKKALGSLIQHGYFYQFWFLGSLIIIYMTLPFLKRMIISFKMHVLLLACLVIVSSLIQLSNFLISHPPVQAHVIQTFRLWTWYAYYLLGGMLGRREFKTITDKLSDWWFNTLAIAGCVLMPWCIFMVCRLKFHNIYAEYFYDSIFVKLLAIVVFLALSRLDLNKAFLSFIKLCSPTIMGIFILHTHLISFLGRFVDFSLPLWNILGLILVLGISFSLAFILSKIPYLKNLIAI